MPHLWALYNDINVEWMLDSAQTVTVVHITIMVSWKKFVQLQRKNRAYDIIIYLELSERYLFLVQFRGKKSTIYILNSRQQFWLIFWCIFWKITGNTVIIDMVCYEGTNPGVNFDKYITTVIVNDQYSIIESGLILPNKIKLRHLI